MRRLREHLLGLLRQGLNRRAQVQQLRFGLAHPFHEDFALAAALPAEAPHDLVQCLLEVVGLAR
jgi:hypothetical protein